MVKREQNDFFWSNKLEPHTARKRELIKAHGAEINKLMGVDPKTKYVVALVVALHLTSAFYASKHLSGVWYFLCAYFIGGTCAHNLFLSIHEVTHYLAFKTRVYNDYLAILSNVPLIIPFAMAFKEYHYEHHRYQGWDGVDTDIPTAVEAKLFSTTLGKIFFVQFQSFFYGIRPVLFRPLAMSTSYVINVMLNILFAFALWKTNPSLLKYLLLSVFLGIGISPMSGHFISEHYVFHPETDQETHSYYGWMNILGYNVGYHNEHHDFPNIPGSKLPQLRALAPEFYDGLKPTPSWIGAMLKFMFDPNVKMWCRMKREKNAYKRPGRLVPTTPDAAK